MIDLDVAVFLIAGAAFVGVGALFVAQLVESNRERRANAAKFAAQLQEWAAERAQRRAANAWHPATTGPTVRLACCAAPDVPDGAAHCIRCGKAVQG